MWHMSDSDLVILTVKIFGIGLFLCAIAILAGALICIGIDEARAARRRKKQEEAKKSRHVAYSRGVASGFLSINETRQLVDTDTQVIRFEDLQRGRDRDAEFRNFTQIVQEIQK